MDNLSKREKRIESKKRKAEAFLNLAKQIEEVQEEMKDSEDESSSAPKKSKMLDGYDGQQTQDALAQYKQLMKERKKAVMEKPKIYLLLDELQFQHSRQMSQDLTFKELPPLFMLDLQHLLLFAIQGNVSSYKPRWCRLVRVGKVTSVVVIVLDGVSSYEFQTYPDCFPRLKAEFEMSAEMVSPEQYGSTVTEELFNVPLSNSVLTKMNGILPKNTRNMISKFTRPPGYFGSDKMKTVNVSVKEETCEMTEINKTHTASEEKSVEISLSTAFTHAEVEINSSTIHKNDAFSRTCLLLNSSQMIAEDFPLPIQYGTHGTYDEYVFTKDSYATVTNQSPMFAIDCEMCVTSAKKYELTRVSVINENLEVVYDSFVKPFNKIIDYVTRYSGVTKFILDPVKTRLHDVQKFLQKTLPPDAIICGQSLKGDLAALRMFHPYVIDTSVIYNLSGHRGQKTSLKRLAAHFLGKDIQESKEGHSSVEDAVTTMELVQLKLKHTPTFGDVVNGGAVLPVKMENQDSSLTVSQNDEDSVEMTDNCDDKNKHKKQKAKNKENSSDNNEKSSDKHSADTDHCDSSESDKCFCDSETDTTCENCNSKKTKHNSKIGESLIQQRKAFFQQAGSQVYESVFKLTKKHNKMVGLIERADVLEQYKDDSMTAIPTKCDRDTKSSGKSLVQFHDFVFMNFPSFRDAPDSCNEEDKMKLLRKQDKRMSKVLKHVRTNSLVAVVMTGRCQEGQDYSAKTFVKIT